MRLKLFNELQDDVLTGGAGLEITGPHLYLRQIGPGNRFFACVGKDTGGHRYIDKAVENGAAAAQPRQSH